MNRSATSNELTIASGEALSEPFSLRRYASIGVSVDAWTTADLGLQACDTEDGTYKPVIATDSNLVSISGFDQTSWYTLPADLFPHRFIKLWSHSAGSDVNQDGDRTLKISAKS